MAKILYGSDQVFHEPSEQPSVRWVTYRRFQQLEAELAETREGLSHFSLVTVPEYEKENQRLRDAIEHAIRILQFTAGTSEVLMDLQEAIKDRSE